MPRKSYVAVIAVLALAVAASLLADSSVDRAIAMKFYPASLDADWEATHAPGTVATRIIQPLRVDFDQTGNDDYLVVAYSNGSTVSLRVIKGATVDSAVLVTEAKESISGDGRPVVTAVDIDNDGTPEIVIELYHATWIYKYADRKLGIFGPTRHTRRGIETAVGASTMIDIDGDGVLELLEIVNGPIPYIVYKLDSTGHFTRQSYGVIFAGRYERHDGAPVTERQSFGAVAGQKATLHVVNGDQAKRSVVSAAVITLNGTTVLGPNDFNKGQRSFSVPVTLTDDNTIAVELRSDPDSTLSLIITMPYATPMPAAAERWGKLVTVGVDFRLVHQYVYRPFLGGRRLKTDDGAFLCRSGST